MGCEGLSLGRRTPSYLNYRMRTRAGYAPFVSCQEASVRMTPRHHPLNPLSIDRATQNTAATTISTIQSPVIELTITPVITSQIYIPSVLECSIAR